MSAATAVEIAKTSPHVSCVHFFEIQKLAVARSKFAVAVEEKPARRFMVRNRTRVVQRHLQDDCDREPGAHQKAAIRSPLIRHLVNPSQNRGLTEMGRQIAVVLYVVAMAAAIVGVDFVFFRHRFWERLIVNIGIVLVFAAFYLIFLRRP
jgi:hypothetical protein